MRLQGMARGHSRVVEPGHLGHPQTAHDRLGRLVEHRGHGPDLVQAGAAEGDPECCPRGFGGIAVVPGAPGQPPADLDAAGAGHAVGHGIEPGEADKLTGRGDLERPQAISEPVEAGPMRSISASLAARLIGAGKKRMVCGSPSRPANGSRSESRQRRISSRAVRRVSNRPAGLMLVLPAAPNVTSPGSRHRHTRSNDGHGAALAQARS